MIEPDVGSLLLQLYRAEGLVPEFVDSTWMARIRLLSNPDNVAVEKLNLTEVPDAFLEEDYKELASGIGGGAFLSLIFNCLIT